MRLERENGTVKYMLTFFVNNSLVQITFLLLNLLVCLAFPGMASYPSIGLWPYIISEITIMCLSDPNRQMMLFFFPCPIKAQYYPYILCAFFTLLKGMIGVDILGGLVYGHIYIWFLKDKLTFSETFCTQMEAKWPFKYLTSMTGD